MSWTRTCYRGQVGIYACFHKIIKNEFTSQKIKSMSETLRFVFLYDIVDKLAIMLGTKETQVDIRGKKQKFPFAVPM